MKTYNFFPMTSQGLKKVSVGEQNAPTRHVKAQIVTFGKVKKMEKGEKVKESKKSRNRGKSGNSGRRGKGGKSGKVKK